MGDVTRILADIEQGDPRAAEQLLPLVYDELRKLAAAKLSREKPGQTLQATALVHEAYLRLVGGPGVTSQVSGVSQDGDQSNLTPDPRPLTREFHSRGHFFAAAAEAMRRILVEQARRKLRIRHGGDLARVNLDDVPIAAAEQTEDLVALDEALERLAIEDRQSAELVKLRFFAGLTIPQVAEVLGISPRQADFVWAYARAWLRREIDGGSGS